MTQTFKMIDDHSIANCETSRNDHDLHLSDSSIGPSVFPIYGGRTPGFFPQDVAGASSEGA